MGDTFYTGAFTDTVSGCLQHPQQINFRAYSGLQAHTKAITSTTVRTIVHPTTTTNVIVVVLGWNSILCKVFHVCSKPFSITSSSSRESSQRGELSPTLLTLRNGAT